MAQVSDSDELAESLKSQGPEICSFSARSEVTSLRVV